MGVAHEAKTANDDLENRAGRRQLLASESAESESLQSERCERRIVWGTDVTATQMPSLAKTADQIG
jgi:hypothetical protein